jgi:LysR family transcriptional regulator, glycine cleavage system transcriptional activator
MPLRLPPLSSLRFFEAAGRHRSFRLAAAELNVTPSAVSHGIVALERALGVELFIREPRTLSLTPEGADYLPYVSEALSLIAIGTQRLPHNRANRTIAVSCADARLAVAAAAAAWLQQAVADYRRHRRHVAAAGRLSRRRLRFRHKDEPGDRRRRGLDPIVRRAIGPGVQPGLSRDPDR